MRKWMTSFISLLFFSAAPAWSALNVFATVPEWGALVKEIGGDHVSVFTATHALQDVHRVEARPSLIARARNADLIVATGADLEVGWLPVVLRECGNARVRPGTPGYFEAAQTVRLLEVPARVDRSQGDVHAAGNPHIQTDPRNLLPVAQALAQSMAELDPMSASVYRVRLADFSKRWRAAIVRWEQLATPLRGQSVLVQHKAFPYLLAWLGMKEVGVLEPKPGVEPTSGHLLQILDQLKQTPAQMVIRPAYQSDSASRWIAQRASIPAVALPFTVGGTQEAKDLFGLYDDTLKRLLAAGH